MPVIAEMPDPIFTNENLDKDIISENPSPLLKEEEKPRDLVPEHREQTIQQEPLLKEEEPELQKPESTFITLEKPRDRVPEHREQNTQQEPTITELTVDKPQNQRQLLTSKERSIIKISALIISFTVSFTVMGVYVHKNKNNIEKITTKSVMSFEPTTEYLMAEDRQMVVKWCLVEEDSQNPFPYLNDTHILFEKDGLYQISVQLQMETEEEVFNIITLRIHLNNIHDKPIMSVKERYPSNHSFNSIQLQPKPRYFKQGDTIYVKVKDPKYLSKDASMSYLTIVEL